MRTEEGERRGGHQPSPAVVGSTVFMGDGGRRRLAEQKAWPCPGGRFQVKEELFKVLSKGHVWLLPGTLSMSAGVRTAGIALKSAHQCA